MRKYLVGILAFSLAIGFSAFTSPKIKNSDDFRYDWYAVSYDTIPGGIIPQYSQVVFTYKTVAEATALDGCTDTYYRHCLRGFYGTAPVFPTAAYDASTPRP